MMIFSLLLACGVCVFARRRERARGMIDTLNDQRRGTANHTVSAFDAVQKRCRDRHTETERRTLFRQTLRVFWRASQATGIRFGLYRGTFLGWLRDCDVNELDHDIDIVVLADDFSRERGVDVHWLHLQLADAGIYDIGGGSEEGVYKHYISVVEGHPIQLIYVLDKDEMDFIDIWIARRVGDYLWTSNNRCDDYSFTRTHTLRRATLLGVDTFVPMPAIDYALDFVGHTWSHPLQVTQTGNDSVFFPGYRVGDCRRWLNGTGKVFEE